jgi:hypothetical protein
MEGNVYAVEVLAAERLAELRAACARMALREAARGGGRGGLARAVGTVLIRTGQWLARGETVPGPNAGMRAAG